MYKTKDFSGLLGSGVLSDELLNTHFKLYDGYVNNFNKLNDLLVDIEKENKFDTPEYAELNRRFGWEFNGMRLHELYFENLVKESKELDSDSSLNKVITDEFGSIESFQKDFKSLCAIRGIGWVVLYYDKSEKRLFNIWVNEHDKGHLAGAEPLLVIDCFEHAYFQDFGSKRPDYIEQIFLKINWSIVLNRFNKLS